MDFSLSTEINTFTAPQIMLQVVQPPTPLPLSILLPPHNMSAEPNQKIGRNRESALFLIISSYAAEKTAWEAIKQGSGFPRVLGHRASLRTGNQDSRSGSRKILAILAHWFQQSRVHINRNKKALGNILGKGLSSYFSIS